MTTINENPRNGNPAPDGGSQFCPACRRKGCPCYIRGRSTTHRHMSSDTRGIREWVWAVMGFIPRHVWQEIVRILIGWFDGKWW